MFLEYRITTNIEKVVGPNLYELHIAGTLVDRPEKIIFQNQSGLRRIRVDRALLVSSLIDAEWWKFKIKRKVNLLWRLRQER